MKNASLKSYRTKRDFNRSPEPAGSSSKSGRKNPRFVIQKHEATSTHYDFRLEADGVLKSWAIPKGPSTDPKDKRLAIRTEDHPLEYARFEGVIPEGEYGAGTVMVWDTGTYKPLAKHEQNRKRNEPKSVTSQIDGGHVAVWLNGKKLRGGYALTKTSGGKGKERWLLVKMDDEEADARRNPTNTQNKSAKSGRTMKQIEREDEPTSFKSKN